MKAHFQTWISTSHASLLIEANYLVVCGRVASGLLTQGCEPADMISFFHRIFGSSKEITAPTAAAVATVVEPASTVPSVEVARLRLAAILERLPAELKPLVLQMPADTVTVALPVSTILKQLASGSVKVSLATVHRQAPAGVLAPLPPGDKRLIEVPLSEVFRHVSPQGLKRRADQRSSDGSRSDFSLFGNAEQPYQIAPTAPEGDLVPNSPAAPPPVPLAFPPVVSPPRGAPAALNGEPAPPSLPERLIAPPPGLLGQTPTAGGIIAPLRPPSSREASATSTVAVPDLALVRPVAPPVTQHPAPLVGKPAAPPAVCPAAESSDACVAVPLASLSGAWPEPIRRELEVLNGSAHVALPTSQVKAGLARGRVSFTWGQIRGWLQPALPQPSATDDATELTLPLKIVAPVFLVPQKRAKAPEPSEFETDIPALFNSQRTTPAGADAAEPTPQADESPAAVEPRAETSPEASLAAPAEASTAAEAINPALLAPVPAAEPAPVTIGELFGDPSKVEWTPADLVAGLAQRPGVLGAVVALQEGLLVANSLPAELNGETIAAFLPQIFARLNQYAGEMQFGEINDLLVTTHGAPCQIYRVGFVYFAVLGKPGATLPASELRLVANALADQAPSQAQF